MTGGGRPPIRLAGERVVLRPGRAEDAGALAQGFADDPTMGAMLGMEPEEETAEWLSGTYRAGGDAAKPDDHWFTMMRPGSEEVIGEIGLVDISRRARRAGISVLVLPAFRRAGAAREAMELLVLWAQRDLGLHRIEVRTLPENLPMQRLAEAAAFVREGVLRGYDFKRGRFVDNIVYSRLPR